MGVYSGGEVKFWKGRISKGGGGQILGERGRFWEGGIDYFLASHIVVEKGSIFWKEGIYSGSATLYKITELQFCDKMEWTYIMGRIHIF